MWLNLAALLPVAAIGAAVCWLGLRQYRIARRHATG
jgi:hypothetical protein